MKFSQELVDDTILPKMDLYDMSMKNKMGKSAKIADVAKSATTKKKLPQTFKIIDIINGNDVDETFGVTLTLSDSSTKKYELFRFDLADNMSNDEFVMDLDRATLKAMAEFILQYLENN